MCSADRFSLGSGCSSEQCDLLLESLLRGAGGHIGKATYKCYLSGRLTSNASREGLTLADSTASSSALVERVEAGEERTKQDTPR